MNTLLRRESALKNSRERTSSYPRPEWCSPDDWYDCISTATSNYGEQNVVTGNGTFYANPEKYGFRRLDDKEQSLPGDIVQAYRIRPNGVAEIPDHGYVINEIDNQGKIKNINYSNGGGVYHTKADNYWEDNDEEFIGTEALSNGSYRDIIGKRRNYRYRYVGTPAERQAIAEHNAAIRAKNAASVQPIPVPVQGISVQPAQLPKRKLTIFDIAKGAE